MSKAQLIKQLSNSTLQAACPKCGGEFQLNTAFLFDGLAPFPQQALDAQAALQSELDKHRKELEKKNVQADEGAERGALASGWGKIFEKVIVAHKDFNAPIRDCRPLYEPIDLIAFHGMEAGEVTSLDFIEIKSGKTLRLNEHEKAVKKAVEDGKVGYKVMK